MGGRGISSKGEGSGERKGEFHMHYVCSRKGYDEWVGLDRVVRTARSANGICKRI